MKLIYRKVWSFTTTECLFSIMSTRLLLHIYRTPFSDFVYMCMHSIVPWPKTMVIGLLVKLVHTKVVSHVAGMVSLFPW